MRRGSLRPRRFYWLTVRVRFQAFRPERLRPTILPTRKRPDHHRGGLHGSQHPHAGRTADHGRLRKPSKLPGPPDAKLVLPRGFYSPRQRQEAFDQSFEDTSDPSGIRLVPPDSLRRFQEDQRQQRGSSSKDLTAPPPRRLRCPELRRAMAVRVRRIRDGRRARAPGGTDLFLLLGQD